MRLCQSPLLSVGLRLECLEKRNFLIVKSRNLAVDQQQQQHFIFALGVHLNFHE